MSGKCLIRPALALCVAMSCAGVATAATITWKSNDGSLGDTTLWSNDDNWVDGAAPVDFDDVVIQIPVVGGSRITNNDLPAGTQIDGIRMTANLNEVNGNSINLGGDVAYTAGGSSIGHIGAPLVLLQHTTFSVSANTSNGRLQMNANISGNFGITKADAGRLRFATTAKNYGGDTIVAGGILDLAADNLIPFGAGKGDVYVGSGAEFALINVNTQINGLNDYLGGAGVVNKSGSNTRNLTVGNNNANGSFSGNITFIGGSSTVNKVGGGTQTFGGTVAVVGASTISGGKVLVNGTWTASSGSAFIVNAGAALGGSGTINGGVTVNGEIAPGTSPNTLEINGPVSFGPAAILTYELNGGNTNVGGGINDLIDDVTNLTLDGVLNISETIAGSFATAANGSTWRLLNYSGTLTDNTLDLGTVPTLPANSVLSIDTASEGQVNLVLTILVPEPTSAILTLFGIVAFGAGYRRRS